MDVQKRVKEYEQLQGRIKDLEQTVSKNEKKSDELANRLYSCEKNLKDANKSAGYKKKGIICLVIALALLVVEILMLIEVIDSEFNPTELAYVFGFILAGFVLFFKARQCQRNGTSKEIQAEIDRLYDEYAPFARVQSELYDTKKKLEEKLEYTGRDWDLADFQATPYNIAAMEKDFVDVLLSCKYMGLADNDDRWLGNWVALTMIHDVMAPLTDDKATSASYDRASEMIRDSDSWILKFINAACVSTGMTVATCAWGTDGEGLSFDEAVEKINLRAPENEDEQAIWDLAHYVFPRIIKKIEQTFRENLNKG